MRNRKIITIVVFALIMVAVVGLVVYEYIDTKTVAKDTVVKAVLVVASAIIALVKVLSGMGGNIPYKKYEAAYAKELEKTFIGDNDKKERKELFNAIHLFNLKLYPRAITSLEKLLKKCQTSGDVYGVKLFLALSYEGTKSGYKAMDIYKEMIKDITHRATPYINLGVLYDLEGKTNEAIECLIEAKRIDPTDYHIYNNLAQMFTANNEYEEAIECAEKTLELKNNFLDALEVLAICYNAIGDDQNAEKYLKKSIQNGSNEAKLRRAMYAYKLQTPTQTDEESDENGDENDE